MFENFVNHPFEYLFIIGLATISGVIRYKLINRQNHQKRRYK